MGTLINRFTVIVHSWNKISFQLTVMPTQLAKMGLHICFAHPRVIALFLYSSSAVENLLELGFLNENFEMHVKGAFAVCMMVLLPVDVAGLVLL